MPSESITRAPHARVILACYNQQAYLPRVLRGYLRQTTSDFSLVIADDGSGTEFIAVVNSFAPLFAAKGISFEHIWHEDKGWRKNRIMNEAVRRAGAETLLVFSDGDCIPPATFVEKHLAVHEPGSFQVAGGVRLSEDVTAGLTEADVESGRFESLVTAGEFRYIRKWRRKTTWGTLLRRRNRPKAIGFNMALDRALFEAVNGFDEVFEWPFLGEDDDLRDRVMKLRPRPKVKNLFTLNDVFHLYHGTKSIGRKDHRGYYETKRPIRCVKGLVDLSTDTADN